MLAGGGRLVYSTCTFSPEENEGVVSAFLHTHPEFSVCGIDAPFFSPGRPDWIQSPAPGLAQTFRLWPHKLRGEGHFAAVLTRNAAGRCSLPFEASCPPSPEFSAFSQEYLTQPLPGRIIRFGQNLCAVPEELPSLSGLRVLRAGLTLGQDKPGRFEPSHALALWLKTARQTVDLAWDSEPLSRYLRGEALPGAASGWTLLRTDGYSIGWAKGSAGMLKNHYPKGLRRFGTEGYFSL
jgi:NOL1/NOP2/fmu family ribosome biogenesis protein